MTTLQIILICAAGLVVLWLIVMTALGLWLTKDDEHDPMYGREWSKGK